RYLRTSTTPRGPSGWHAARPGGARLRYHYGDANTPRRPGQTLVPRGATGDPRQSRTWMAIGCSAETNGPDHTAELDSRRGRRSTAAPGHWRVRNRVPRPRARLLPARQLRRGDGAAGE